MLSAPVATPAETQSISATICIGLEIQCLLYVEFFTFVNECNKTLKGITELKVHFLFI